MTYSYFIIDDCWSIGRDNKSATLLPDPSAFPKGIGAFIRDIHSLGFKFGIYTDRGTLTCQRRPGSLDHEKLDAKTFASWGVDYLKEDSCFADQTQSVALAEYGKMRDGLNATNRPIFFALCGWRRYFAYSGQSLANSWRVAPDNVNWDAVYVSARALEDLVEWAGPGGWNDGDLLLGSDSRVPVHLTPRQSRCQFSIWCVAQSALIISGLGALDKDSFDWQTYSNTEALRVSQTLGFPPGRVLYSTCWSCFFCNIGTSFLA